MIDNDLPQIISRQTKRLSSWVSVDAVTVRGADPNAAIETYHGIRQADYVNVLAMTRKGLFAVIRQFRPIIDAWTLELPGGLRDADEQPSQTAIRELMEETGLKAVELVPLIDTFADTGRLTNRLFGFFAIAEGEISAEHGLTAELISGDTLRARALDNRLSLPSNMALLYVASVHPNVASICAKMGLSVSKTGRL